jgi:hypothetical protein
MDFLYPVIRSIEEPDMNTTRKIILISLIFSLVAMAAVAFFIMNGAVKNPENGKNNNEVIDEENPPWAIIIPVMVTIIGLSLVPFFKIFFPGTIKNGVAAEATVLKVWDTGVSINDNPQVGLLLDVHPPTGATFQAEAKKVVSRLQTSLIQPGVNALVLYDPTNPKRLEVKSFQTANAAPGIGDVEMRLSELNRLRDKELITKDEYDKKREEIIKSL